MTTMPLNPDRIPDRYPRDLDDYLEHRPQRGDEDEPPKPTPGHFCHYRNRKCPPFCSEKLGGCDPDGDDDE